MINLRKDVLQVDTTYQRRSSHDRILRIAREWSWLACGTLIVADRKKAGYWVVDCQHRKLAADRRSDIVTLPCIVFEVSEIAIEAAGFLAANTMRRPITLYDRYRALHITNDPAVAAVDRLVHDAGRTIAANNGATTVACIGALLKPIRAGHLDAVKRVWPIIVELSANRPIVGELVKGMIWLETHLGDGHSLSWPQWHHSINRLGYEPLMQSIMSAAAFSGNRGEKTCGLGIAHALNKGRRQKLPLRGDYGI